MDGLTYRQICIPFIQVYTSLRYINVYQQINHGQKENENGLRGSKWRGISLPQRIACNMSAQLQLFLSP
jgi:hypothetical protein